MATILESAVRFDTDDERWQAVLRRDGGADGRFVYAVRTTGVYCRPSCAARRPRRENVEFHRTWADAEREGFRACRRCRPKEPSPRKEHAEAVARACVLIADWDGAPDLKTIAAAAGMSPSHFHRVFKTLTGLTPKGYATARRSQRVRAALGRSRTVTAAIYDAGFGSSSRFYERSTEVLGMTPTEFRKGGPGASIVFAVGECSLGAVLVAASTRGICAVSLGDDPDALVHELERRFPKADLIGGDREFEQIVARVVAFVERPATGLDLPLDVQGTAFQHRVWRALREIPFGETRSYSEIAKDLGAPAATRAVAGACAANPVAVAIPCHRVVRADGAAAGYRWGVERKTKLLEREGGAAGS